MDYTKDDNGYLIHPSFGKITICKSSGNQRIFGSEVTHPHCVRMTVETARIKQDVHGDCIFGDKTVVELKMSEAQWAHMLSSFGDGSGTPVTLVWVPGEGYVGDPPVIPKITDVQKQAVDETVRNIAQQMKDIETKFEDLLKLPTIRKKDVENLRFRMNILRSHFVSNLRYYEDATKERMEKEVANAAIEIDALVNRYVHSLGLNALEMKTKILVEPKKE